ncbi:MAG: trp RNA-binding attenuation protein MtrB [Christensenellales bacterium]|jgi:transcription attenuation protein (tryptophan RNA-binding attenuator protein)
MDSANICNQDYIVVKALEDGVNIIGMTRGRDTKFHHTEKLDNGEVMIAQFTENTSAIKIRGRAQILTAYGTLNSGKTEE